MWSKSDSGKGKVGNMHCSDSLSPSSNATVAQMPFLRTVSFVLHEARSGPWEARKMEYHKFVKYLALGISEPFVYSRVVRRGPVFVADHPACKQ